MVKRKPGNKYPLIIYQKKWGMLWKLTLALGAAMGFAWWHASVGRIPQVLPPRDRWLFLGAAVCLAFSVFAFFAERLNYVQPYPTYFKIVTPLLRLKISYQRIQSVRPVNLNQIFPPKDAKSSIVSVLEPYYGLTSAGIEMTGYPLDEKILRIFLPREMFLPHTRGLLLVIRNWLKFSTEFDSYKASWVDRRSGKKKEPGLLASLKYDK